MNRPASSTARLATLEMLRGAASVAVVFHHMAQQTQGDTLAASATGRLMLWLGGWGVTVFFVLSGFCIHGSILRHAPGDRLEPVWHRYFIHRARRILPGYLVALGLCVALGGIADSNLITRARWLDIWTHLTFTSGFSQDTALRLNSVLWTVVVEVHFYLAYPVFVWCRNRMGMARLTVVLLALSVCIKLGGRLWLDESARWTWHHSFVNLWWIWALGALLAEWHAAGTITRRWPRGAAIGVILISLLVGCFDARSMPLAWHVVETFGQPLLAAAVVAMVVFSPLAGLRSKIAEHLGTVSYSMYLFHPVALWAVVQAMPSGPLITTAGLMLALSYGFAVLGYRLVERPFLK